MDHTYNFYKGLCYLQLNRFDEAEKLFEEYVNEMYKKMAKKWVHPTALFYYGISKYEQKKYQEAIIIFDRALNNTLIFLTQSIINLLFRRIKQ